jgi:hypothetical protein
MVVVVVSSPGEAPQKKCQKGKKKSLHFVRIVHTYTKPIGKQKLEYWGGLCAVKSTRFGRVSCQYLVLPAINQVGK